MPRLLHIASSPFGERSGSIALGRHFVECWQAAGAARTTATRNLWDCDLPELRGDLLAARSAVEGGGAPRGAGAGAWSRVRALAAELLEADRLLVSAPMWNFGLPYRLKQYVDCVTQPTLTYRGNPAEGFQGLVQGTPAALVLTRGGSYPAGSDREALDFQRRYLEAWLRFLGFRPVHAILAEPTTGSPEALRAAGSRARELAARF